MAEEGGTFVAPGGTPIHEVAKTLGRTGWGSGGSVATLNGLITAYLHRIPQPGDEVDVEGVRLRVISVRKRLADEVEVRMTPPSQSSSGDSTVV